MPKLSIKSIQKYFLNYFKIKFKINTNKLNPLFFSYYITLNCNFNCLYCSYSYEGVTKRPDNKLNTDDVHKLLNIIKRECDDIYFTGGEPLLRKDLVEILKKCKRIGFNSVGMNTNMSLIHNNMDVLDYLSELVASYDVVNTKKHAKILGVPESIVRQVKENIINCAKLQNDKKFQMTINCVVTPETINDAREVLNFSLKNNIRYAVAPAMIDWGEINKELKNSQKYKELIKDIIEQKRKTKKMIFGSTKYLENIINFENFDCYPNLIPRIYPNGDLLWPCEILKKYRINLLKEGSYKKVLKKCIKIGKIPKCDNRCHMSCYIEPSCFLKNPLVFIKEFC